MTRQDETKRNPGRQDLLEAGLAYLEGGINLIPVNSRKTPADPPLPFQRWKKLQKEQVTKDLLRKWADTPGVQGWAMVCGKISGGLTILDFDVPGFLEKWKGKVGEMAQVLPTQQTGSGEGYQVAFRSNLPIRNDKLAYVPADNEEGRLTAIETRGEGGYAVVAPSYCPEAVKCGKKHSQPYKVIQGDFSNIPTISNEQAQFLLDAARSLDEMPHSKKQMEAAPLSSRNGLDGGVINAFNDAYDVATILERNGYERRGNRFLAPASTTGLPGVHIFENGRCFSHHANDPLNDGHSHDPFSIFCLLQHGGDVRAAVKAAAEAHGIERTQPHSAATGGAWPEPEPLRRSPEPCEPFPVEALGGILAPAARAMHDIIKAPAAICGQAVLATANLTVQGFANVAIDGRSFPLSEFFLSVAVSGDRKSAADHAALVPVDAHEKELNEAYKKDFSRYENELLLWKKIREEALKKTRGRREALDDLPPAPFAPHYPQLTTEEPTYEGVTKLLAVGWPSVGLFSDEGGRFFGGYAMSADHRLKTLAGLSGMWDGRPITRTRGGDGATTLYGRRVCAHLLMQPLVAETILSDPLAHDQGFLSRCLIAASESTLGAQTYVAQDLSIEASYGRYCGRLTVILRAKLPLKVDPATRELTNELVPRALPVSPDGKEIWIRFHDWVQDHLKPGGIFRPISGIAAKAAEHALRLAGTLTLVDNIDATFISPEHVKAGITLARFYLTEALRLFHTGKTNPDILLTEKVLTWLKTRTGPRPQLLSLPCVYQTGPNAVRDKATAARCLALLADHGCVRMVEGGAEIDGKKRRQVWEVNPNV